MRPFIDTPYGFEYETNEIKLPGDVPCVVKASGESDEDQESYEGRYHSQLSVEIGKTPSEKLWLQMHFVGHMDGSHTQLNGMDLTNSNGDTFGLVDSPDTVGDSMHRFQEPLESLIKHYNEVPEEAKYKSLENFKGNLKIQRIRETNHEIMGADFGLSIPKSVPPAMSGVPGFKGVQDVLPLNFHGEDKLYNEEKGVVHLATWLGASLQTHGSKLLMEPMLDLMSSGPESRHFNKSISTFLKTIPPGSANHNEFVRKIWSSKRACA